MKLAAGKRSNQSSSLPRARSKAVAEAVSREVGGSGTSSVVGETIRYEDANYHDSGRITKSNALIEANYRLTLMETRVILLCISRIDSRHPLEAQRVFRVQASEFQATFGVGREKAYQHLKEVSDRLFERKVELRNPTTGTIGKNPLGILLQIPRRAGRSRVAFRPRNSALSFGNPRPLHFLFDRCDRGMFLDVRHAAVRGAGAIPEAW
ncbi:MAG: replication initiation protein [Rhodanobacteraceae bacterium]|nr:replication initiation protein [Rhodanobacteraceae bacterium]